MRTFNEQIATAEPLNTDVEFDFVPLKNIYMYCMTAIVTGTPTGTIKLQASNDPETNDTQPLTNAPPTHWVDIANSSFNLTSAGSTMWNVSQVAYNYVRVVYIDTSGGTSTATAMVIVNGKGA